MNTTQAARLNNINELERVMIGTFGFALIEWDAVQIQEATKLVYQHKNGARIYAHRKGRVRMSVTHTDGLGVEEFDSIPEFLRAVEKGF